MNKYNHLTAGQRYQIESLKAAEKSQKAIAQMLGVSESTISRELKRNSGKRGYRPRQAQIKTVNRRREARKAIKMTPDLIGVIEGKLREDWSPEQVSGWLKREQSTAVSHERIYQHIWTNKRAGGELYKHLRQSRKQRKKRYGAKDKRGQIKNRTSIDLRPEVVEQKVRLGDWEIDTVIGQNHQGALVTVVDRVSKFTLIKKVDSKHAEGVAEATIALLKPYRDKALTITADNGKEFAEHEKIAAALQATVYFAHPYHSWERGINENTNGLIRQYFPKGSSFADITDAHVDTVMNKLNQRPRKTLNYRTPHEVFFNEKQRQAA